MHEYHIKPLDLKQDTVDFIMFVIDKEGLTLDSPLHYITEGIERHYPTYEYKRKTIRRDRILQYLDLETTGAVMYAISEIKNGVMG